MLSVTGLCAGYGGGTVLNGITLHVPVGTVSVIIGANGAGKTTLLHSITGLLTPYAGTVMLDAVDLTGSSTHRVARAGVGLVPQGRRIWASLTVHEHLQLPRCSGSRTVREPARAWTPDRVRELFPPLAARWRHRAGTLSGGEQQMLAVARALITQPRLLLLDEPTEGLSPALTAHLLDVVTTLPSDGITVLATASSAVAASQVADQVHVLAGGRLTTTASGARARADPALLAAPLSTPLSAPRPAGEPS